MTWRCPACSTQVHHNLNEAAPRAGAVYRCSVCRLELVVDPCGKLSVAPLGDDKPPKSATGRSKA